MGRGRAAPRKLRPLMARWREIVGAGQTPSQLHTPHRERSDRRLTHPLPSRGFRVCLRQLKLRRLTRSPLRARTFACPLPRAVWLRDSGLRSALRNYVGGVSRARSAGHVKVRARNGEHGSPCRLPSQMHTRKPRAGKECNDQRPCLSAWREPTGQWFARRHDATAT